MSVERHEWPWVNWGECLRVRVRTHLSLSAGLEFAAAADKAEYAHAR